MFNAQRQNFRAAGILIFLGIIIGIGSVVPVVESENFLWEVFPDKNQVFIGAFFQFLLIPIYGLFSLVLFPFLEPHGKSLSIGFVGFRFIGASFQMLGLILLPVFVLLSKQYLQASPEEFAWFESVGEILKLVRDLINHVGVILPMALGNILFYMLLVRNKLAPNWLIIWGLGANILIMIAGFLIVFQVLEVISMGYAIFSLPLVFQEIGLAIWLIRSGLKVEIGK